MFTDEVQRSVCVESSWRQARHSEQQSRGCQTAALHNTEAGVQTALTSVIGTQTETQESEPPFQCDGDGVEAPGLKDFLQRVEDRVIRELVKNARSHAFDGFQANWEDHSEMVCCLHRLEHPSAQEQNLHISCVSWNCTGAVIACAYGRISDGDWGTDKSYVCTWNLDRRGLNPKRADQVIDVSTVVTAMCCHPEQPALIAGGLYSGEVVVWDTSRTKDPVLAQTGMSKDSHREPVYQVSWVPLEKKGQFGLLSGSSGGQVLLWGLDWEQGSFVLSAAYILVQQQVPHCGSYGFKGRGSSFVGVTSLALSPWDSDTFLVGSEGGLLLRCSFSSQTPAAVAHEGQSVTPRAPAVFSFKPGSGPVYSIQCSPFHRNLFLSAGTDGLAHLHSLLQTDPLLSLRVSDSYVFKVQWSPTRPLLFAAATGHGEVQIFDLGLRSLKPAATIDQGGDGHGATCLAFNSKNPRLLAAGKTDGIVYIWQLSSDLTEQIPTESSQLEQIASQVAD